MKQREEEERKQQTNKMENGTVEKADRRTEKEYESTC